MTSKTFRVDSETLTLIDRYLKSHPNGQKSISEAITRCITTLKEADSGKHSMLEETSIVLLVKPKKDFKKIVTKKYGKKGPYKVSKVVKSFTQTNEGFYSLEGSESIYPAEWFQEIPAENKTIFLPYLLAIVWGIMLFGSGYAIAILQYVCMLTLL